MISGDAGITTYFYSTVGKGTHYTYTLSLPVELILTKIKASTAWEVFKARSDGAIGNINEWKGSMPMARGWN